MALLNSQRIISTYPFKAGGGYVNNKLIKHPLKQSRISERIHTADLKIDSAGGNSFAPESGLFIKHNFSKRALLCDIF